MRLYHLLLLIFFLGASTVSAQANPGINPNTGLPVGVNEQISKKMSPSIPKPGEQVNLSINIFSTNLDKANISWYVDGALETQGQGIKSINVTAPRAGSVKRIEVVIGKEEGGTLRENFVIAPAEVDILYESYTYTPPFYKGKSLFTNQSIVRFVADPLFITQSGTRLDPDNLIYEWKINNQPIKDSSGVGRRIFNYLGSLIQRDSRISVDVSAKNSDLKARREIQLRQYSPVVQIYEKNPIFGLMFEQAITGKFELLRNEIEFKAIPYYFSAISSNDADLSYKWLMNGNNIGVSRLKNSMVFRNNNDQSGTANIDLEVTHLENILQAARTSSSIDFEPAGSRNFEF